MSEQQPSLPKVYNSRDHLITIPTKNGPKEYYPAAWRLYELNLRYEEANFSSEILFMDLERNFVIVKCKLYLGPEYEMSHRKTEAMKQGQLSQLDKLETAAKARCARDLGISTELALDMEDGEINDAGAPHSQEASPTHAQAASVQSAQPTNIRQPAKANTATASSNDANNQLDSTVAKDHLNVLYTRAKKLNVCKTEQEFVAYFCKLLKLPTFDINTITRQHLGTIEHDLKAREKQAA